MIVELIIGFRGEYDAIARTRPKRMTVWVGGDDFLPEEARAHLLKIQKNQDHWSILTASPTVMRQVVRILKESDFWTLDRVWLAPRGCTRIAPITEFFDRTWLSHLDVETLFTWGQLSDVLAEPRGIPARKE